MSLIINDVFSVSGIGTVVAFESDPNPWWEWKAHKVKITLEDKSSFLAEGRVEFARKVPPGEVMVLVFPELLPKDLPPGSKVEQEN